MHKKKNVLLGAAAALAAGIGVYKLANVRKGKSKISLPSHLAFTNVNLFNGKLDSDLQENVTLLVALEKKGEAGRAQMTVAEIAAICDEAHRGGYKVMTHCESTLGIHEALLGGVDSIEHGAPIPDDLVALFKDNPKALNGYTTLVSTISAPLDLCELGTEVLKIPEVVQQNGDCGGHPGGDGHGCVGTVRATL